MGQWAVVRPIACCCFSQCWCLRLANISIDKYCWDDFVSLRGGQRAENWQSESRRPGLGAPPSWLRCTAAWSSSSVSVKAQCPVLRMLTVQWNWIRAARTDNSYLLPSPANCTTLSTAAAAAAAGVTGHHLNTVCERNIIFYSADFRLATINTRSAAFRFIIDYWYRPTCVVVHASLKLSHVQS